jgi:glycogen debranching enzyme
MVNEHALEIRVGPPTITIHADRGVLVSEPDASMHAERPEGFFLCDTRLVSGWRLRLNGEPLTLLNSAAVSSYGARYELTNPATDTPSGPVPEHTMHIRIDRTIGQGLHEDVDLCNYGPEPVECVLELRVESDFADLAEVKAGRTGARGRRCTSLNDDGFTNSYEQQRFRRALQVQVASASSPAEYADGRLRFRFCLERRVAWHACVSYLPDLGDGPLTPEHTCHAVTASRSARRRDLDDARARCATIVTSDPMIDAVLDRSIADLVDLRIDAQSQAATAGGIPWFVTLFGRDSLVMALQTLPVSSEFARGTLEALAALQADHCDDWRDAEPGKIEHEIRHGEPAQLGRSPRSPYYGTHDATTLFVLAAARAHQWDRDRRALDHIRPNVEAALDWIDHFGDRDGDGLQEYATRSTDGMRNQGWKDAGDAIVHADGSQAEPPIATCELQGYVVAAKRAWADVLEHVYEDDRRAGTLRASADRLAELIEERFWWAAEDTYYLGLDRDKRPIASVTSNPGHLLWSGAVSAVHARRVALRLLADDMWSGWGVRTLSADHPAYNPLSYQRGAVWPHDNGLLVAGLCRYGLGAEGATIARALFDAADNFQRRRLPEVFAGFAREPGSFPAQYLGSNVPQGWAAGAALQMVLALLGIEPAATGERPEISPDLPEWLPYVRVAGVRVGDTTWDLTAERGPNGDATATLDRR